MQLGLQTFSKLMIIAEINACKSVASNLIFGYKLRKQLKYGPFYSFISWSVLLYHPVLRSDR